MLFVDCELISGETVRNFRTVRFCGGVAAKYFSCRISFQGFVRFVGMLVERWLLWEQLLVF